MKTSTLALVLVALAPACLADYGDADLSDDEAAAQLGDGDQALTGDNDGDGIVDTTENALATKFAPQVRLHPSETARPANVDWYLAQPSVHMRYSHSGCPDHTVIADGNATQSNLSTQSHATTDVLCNHTSTIHASNASHVQFFLQPTNDAVHAGTTDTTKWRTYAHVKKSTLVSGGYDIQYWFFYPYNDGPASINHEADWEHITVTADANQNFYSAFYAQHHGGTRYSASQLTFVSTTHPVVYSAVGTHASYNKAGDFAVVSPVFTDHTATGGTTYLTSSNLVNVGEKSAPLSSQNFIKYGGRWGEIGSTSDTSGPQGPSFQATWTTY